MLWVIVLGFVAVACGGSARRSGATARSDDTKQLRKRATSAFKARGVRHARGARGADRARRRWRGTASRRPTAGVLGLPGGQWIVGAVGLGIVVAGGSKIYAGWKKKFEDDMNMPYGPKARTAVVRTGQVGFIAKGVSIGVIGMLVVVAAIQFDPAKAAGLDAALHALTQTPLGPWLLVVVALGLAAYGRVLRVRREVPPGLTACSLRPWTRALACPTSAPRTPITRSRRRCSARPIVARIRRTLVVGSAAPVRRIPVAARRGDLGEQAVADEQSFGSRDARFFHGAEGPAQAQHEQPHQDEPADESEEPRIVHTRTVPRRM